MSGRRKSSRRHQDAKEDQVAVGEAKSSAKKRKLGSEGGTAAEAAHPETGEASATEAVSTNQNEGINMVEFENSLGYKLRLLISNEFRNEVGQLMAQTRAGKPVTAAQLKYYAISALAMLIKYNDRPVYNMTKIEIAALVADYINNGTPPRCPRCKVGALRFSNGKKKFGKKYYWCPGRYVDQSYYGCGFRAEREEIERIPFKCP